MAKLGIDDVNLAIKAEEEYDEYKKPANLTLARQHGEAKKVYKKRQVKKDKNGQEIPETNDLCACCLLPLKGEKISLFAGLEELYHLGTGFALYFKFIKYSIGILTLIMLTMGIFNLVTNVVTGDCTIENSNGDAYCVQGYILSFTIPNKKENKELLLAQTGVNLATVIIVMFFFQYLRYQFRKTEVEAENANITPSDYTVVIEGVPPEATKGEIETWIDGFSKPEKPLKVVRTIKPRAITNYVDLKNQEKVLLEQQTELKSKEDPLTQSETKKMKRLDSNLGKLRKQLDTLKNKEFEHTPVAYVTFAEAGQANDFLEVFKESLAQTFCKLFLSSCIATKNQFRPGVTVEVKRAPEPTDILWQNLGVSAREKKIKSAITNFASAVLILITFGLIILINWGQDKLSEQYGKKSVIVQVMSFVGSIVICSSNFVLAMTIDYLTSFEKHSTYTHFLQGVAQKLAVAQFVNTALSTLFAELILADTKDQQSSLQAINFYGKGGLLESIYWVFITNAFLVPFLTILDLGYQFRRFKRFLHRGKTEAPNLMQKDAQTLFEGSAIALPAKYATILKVVLMTCLYAPAMPFALIYASIGLFLTYWADKYNLLRHNALPKQIDDSLTDSMVEYLEWASCAFSVGNIIYIFSLKNSAGDLAFPIETTPFVWISLGVSLFHIIFPMELLNVKLFPIKDEVTETDNFEQARLRFTTDYEITNPLTSKQALKDHRLRLQKSMQNGEGHFFQRAFNSNVGGLAAGLGDGVLKETEQVEEFNFAGLDEYCAKTHHRIQDRPLQTSPGLDFFSNVNKQFAYMIPDLQDDASPGIQPNQEAATPEKSSLLPLPLNGPGSKVPTYNGGERFDFNEEAPIVDLAALNFVGPHFQRDMDDDRGSRHGSHHSGDLDPNECVEERERSAREFSVNRTVFDKSTHRD